MQSTTVYSVGIMSVHNLYRWKMSKLFHTRYEAIAKICRYNSDFTCVLTCLLEYTFPQYVPQPIVEIVVANINERCNDDYTEDDMLSLGNYLKTEDDLKLKLGRAVYLNYINGGPDRRPTELGTRGQRRTGYHMVAHDYTSSSPLHTYGIACYTDDETGIEVCLEHCEDCGGEL